MKMEESTESSTSTKETKSNKNPWLNAWNDPLAGITALSGCVTLCDIYGDGDNKLIIADANKIVKIYKGTNLISEIPLLGTPVAVCTFYTNVQQTKTPIIAVASGSCVYLYRNLRPYSRFLLPTMSLDLSEKQIWEGLCKCEIDIPTAVESLNKLRDEKVNLSIRSRGLLAIDDIEQQAEFVSRKIDEPLVQISCVVCMANLNKSMEQKDAVSSLIIGTEDKQVYILDHQGTSIIKQCTLPSVPVKIAATGLFDVEYRINVTCRNSSIYTIKNGEVLRGVIELESQPIDIVQLDRSLIVGTMDRRLMSYHFKGKKSWSLNLQYDIMSLEKFYLGRTKTTTGVLVALKNGDIHLYNEKIKIAECSTNSPATTIKFGQYGREEGSLIIIQNGGGMVIKILQRNAQLDGLSETSKPPAEQDIPLNIPKKTKLYVEQTQRERDQAIEMHRIFQKDLCRLRLTTARSYVKILKDGHGSVSYGMATSVRLNAKVQGIGPLFKIKLDLVNTGSSSVINLPIAFHFDHELYQMKSSLLQIPLLIPNVQYKHEVDIESISKIGSADDIFIYISNRDSSIPLLSAVVSMPISEIPLE